MMAPYHPPHLMKTVAVCVLLGVGAMVALAVLALDKRSPVERARRNGAI